MTLNTSLDKVRRMLLKTLGGGAVAMLAGRMGAGTAQDKSGAEAAQQIGCYPAYDKEWPWPVQLDPARQKELPPYSTRNYFIEQISQVRPTHHFAAGKTNPSQWRTELRQKLRSRLELDRQPGCSLNPRLLGSREFDGYKIEEMVFQSEPGVWVPALLYLPANSTRTGRTLISCHGHGIGINDPLYTYISDFVRRGFIVFVPEVRDFGQRAFGRPQEMSCDRTYKLAALLGRNLAGLRLWDFIRGLDYLRTRPEVDPNRIVGGGLSLGGELAMLLAALDERIRAAFISGFLCTYEGLMFRVNNCICYTIPGILEVCHMSDIAGLIAPRPLVVQSGTRDRAVPTEYAQQAFRHLASIYQAVGASERVALDVFEGEHEFHGEKTFGTFERWV